MVNALRSSTPIASATAVVLTPADKAVSVMRVRNACGRIGTLNFVSVRTRLIERLTVCRSMRAPVSVLNKGQSGSPRARFLRRLATMGGKVATYRQSYCGDVT